MKTENEDARKRNKSHIDVVASSSRLNLIKSISQITRLPSLANSVQFRPNVNGVMVQTLIPFMLMLHQIYSGGRGTRQQHRLNQNINLALDATDTAGSLIFS